MCLTYHLNVFDVTKDPHIGYKAFCKGSRPQTFKTPIQCLSKNYKEDKWYTDTNDYSIEYDYSYSMYQTGFHIFLNRAAAVESFQGMKIVIKKVEFKEVVAQGWDNGKVVVARQMKILPD
jgi:hypothetical protein